MIKTSLEINKVGEDGTKEEEDKRESKEIQVHTCNTKAIDSFIELHSKSLVTKPKGKLILLIIT